MPQQSLGACQSDATIVVGTSARKAGRRFRAVGNGIRNAQVTELGLTVEHVTSTGVMDGLSPCGPTLP